MRHGHLILAVCAIALAGCDRNGSGQIMRQVRDVQGRVAQGPAQQFSYRNYWDLSMPRGSVTPRFERTRNACLADKSLNCKLNSASINAGTEDIGFYAQVDVLLPHDKIEPFKRGLLAPVADEAPGDVAMASNSTNADNVEEESTEAGRKVGQLNAYLERLQALSKRPNLNIEDTIRLETEISRVQGELNAAMKTKEETDGRVARESVTVTLNDRPPGAIASMLGRASDIFIQNIAAMLSFLIGLIPWLPVIAVALFVGHWLWRLLTRKKTAENSATR